VVLKVIQSAADMYEWFINEWVQLVVIDPSTRHFYRFKDGGFTEYKPLIKGIAKLSDLTPLIEKRRDNLPVYILK
jgi:hypothetical protein